MKSQSSHLLISFVLLGLAFSLFYIASVRGDATIGISLRTNDDLNQNLVAHWTFDADKVDRSADTAEILDSGSGGNNGNWRSHSTTTAVGRIGQAIDFDGDDDNILIANDAVFQITGGITLAAWVYPHVVSGNQVIVGNMFDTDSDGYYMRLGADALQFSFGNGTTDFDNNSGGFGDIRANEWQHVLVTYDESDVRFYINGALNETDSVGESMDPNLVTGMHIGVHPDGTNYNFDGIIDDVRIYDKALTPEEVSRVYGLGATTKVGTTIEANDDLRDGLVGHWTFDSDAVDSSQPTAEIRDTSGSGNHGDWLEHATTTKPGKLGQALEFDGSSSRVRGTSPLQNPPPEDGFSMFAWIKANEGAPQGTPIEGRHYVNFNLQRESNSEVRCWISGDISGQIATPFEYTVENDWNHVGCSYSTTTKGLTLYINGASSTSAFIGLLGDFLHSGTRDFVIGARADDQNHFDGEVDDFRIYDRPLTEEEVLRLYQLGATTKLGVTIGSDADLDTGLVGHWTFDGAYIDRSSSTGEILEIANRVPAGDWINHGTTTAIGKIGQGIYFDGINDYVDLGDYADMGTDDMSVSFWIKDDPSQTAEAQLLGIASKGARINTEEGWTIGYDHTPGNFFFWLSDGTSRLFPQVTGLEPFNDYNWHHVVVMFDRSGSAMAYFDGVQQTVGASNISSFNGTDISNDSIPLKFGRNGNDDYFNTTLDDIRIYNRLLSEDEIQKLYSLGN